MNILSVIETSALVRSGERSAAEVVAETLTRIARYNPALNAFVFVDAAGAQRSAEDIDSRISRGEDVGPLAGVPFGIKDNEDVVGMPTSFGSLLHKGGAPAQQDSTPVARLRAAGAIPIGKTAAAEFGLDGITHTQAWGTTRNPWDLTRTPSGSSGGSAAAVSAGLVPFCTASDGGGSIRVPAAFTGLVGLKPTHGRIPRPNGASDITSPGVLTRTVADTARCLDIVSGPDDRDRMSLPRATFSFEQVLADRAVRGMRAIWSADMGFAPVEPEVAASAVDAARTLCRAAGISLSEDPVRLTNTYPEWAKLAGHRLRVRLERTGHYPARLHLLSEEPRRLINRFGHLSDFELAEAAERILCLEREVAELFSKFDLLLTPTAACVAYAAEGPLPEIIAGKDAKLTNGEPFTVLANCCWNPSISVPAGAGAHGLPVGLMITGRRHQDEIVLRFAQIAETIMPWPQTAPGYDS